MQAKYWERWLGLNAVPNRAVPLDHALIVITRWPNHTVDDLPNYAEGVVFSPFWTNVAKILALRRTDATAPGSPQPVLEILVAVRPTAYPLARLQEVVRAWTDLQKTWLRTEQSPYVEVIEGDVDSVMAFLRGEPVTPPRSHVPWAAIGVGLGALAVTLLAGPLTGLVAGAIGAGAAGMSYIQGVLQGSGEQRSESVRNLMPYVIGGVLGVGIGMVLSRR